MKTLKTLCIACITLLTFNCNKDDDSSGSQLPPPTTLELLTSGKWYFESKTPDPYTACEKNGYIQFMANGNLILNSFDGDATTCESLGEVAATYTLNGMNISLVFGSDSQSAIITSISATELKISNTDNGEQIVFDKTEG